MLRLYEREAIGVDPAPVAIARDLNDIILAAKYAREHGAEQMTLSYQF